MIAIVIGTDNKTRLNAAYVLAQQLGLKMFDNYVFKSSSLQSLEPGIYISNNIDYMQAKKMRPDLLVQTFEPQKIHKKATFYKIVDANGNTVRSDKGNFYDRINTKRMAFCLLEQLNNNTYKIEKYES